MGRQAASLAAGKGISSAFAPPFRVRVGLLGGTACRIASRSISTRVRARAPDATGFTPALPHLNMLLIHPQLVSPAGTPPHGLTHDQIMRSSLVLNSGSHTPASSL